MHARRQEPLGSHERFRDGDADALAAFLAVKNIEIEVRRSDQAASPLCARLNAAYLDGTYLSYMHYGSPVRLRVAPPRPDYGLWLPIDGSFEAALDGCVFDCGRNATVVASPSSLQSYSLSETCSRIGVSFARDAVVRHLAALLGEAVTREIVFEPSVDLATGPGRRLRHTLSFVLEELELQDGPQTGQLWQRELEQLALTALLVNLRHNWSGRLNGPVSTAAPADVRRAIDYVHAHLDAPVGLAELAAAAGVPGRTLLRHFRDFTGKSPLAYVRAARLWRARVDLLRGDGASVTDVAARWGFSHFGRFAAEYRGRFGELPSQTRRRAR